MPLETGRSTASQVARTVSNGVGHAIKSDYSKAPVGLQWRSNTLFIITTVGVGIFTDLFLYGLIVPVVPFMLQDRVGVPKNKIQSNTSMLLAVYAGASVIFSPVAGVLADKTTSRQVPFLLGLTALLLATLLFAVSHSLTVLVIARILQGLSGSVVWTIGLALCLETVGPNRLGTVIGSIFSVISVGTQASPTIGGILYEKAGFGGVFGVGIAILVIDFIMRLLVIEKKVAARYEPHQKQISVPGSDAEEQGDGESNEEPDEQSPLLGRNELNSYRLEVSKNGILRHVPILACLKDASLLSALWLAFVQALFLGSFDSTIPTLAEDYYGFNSLEAGVLFLSLGIADLVMGPIGGWWVDKHGTKAPAVASCIWLVPGFALLKLVQPGGKEQIILWAALLAVTGIGMGVFGSPSIVEAGAVTEKYYNANPEFFGDNGPYAQLYGLNSMCFCAGLTLGPLIAGLLKDSIGYGNMNAVFSAVAALTAVVSFLFIGGKPKLLQSKFV